MDHKIDEAWLDTIEGQISELSVAITATRIDLINELNNLQNNELKNNLLTNNFPPVEVKLSGKVEILLSENPALEVENYVKLMLKKSRFSSENFNVGPNYTIIQFINIKKNKNTDFLSTGEQKLVLISLILAHARMLNQKFNMSPILLLDDIIEHLDKDYRKSLFEEIMRHQAQTWFTSTSKEAFDDYPGLIRKIDLLKVKQSNKAKYDFRHGEV
jgi:DNA replication and repair protein RecF